MALTNSISKRTVVIDATPIPNDGIIEVTQTQTIEAPIVTQTWGKPEHTVAAKNDKKFTISATASSKACAMLLKILKEQEMKEEKCNEISRYYAEKSKETKEKKEALKIMIMETMEKLGVKKIETSTGTFTIRKNAPALIIEDDRLIPWEFKTIVQQTKIEKAEIKKALKDGVEIGGVRLESSQSLLVK